MRPMSDVETFENQFDDQGRLTAGIVIGSVSLLESLCPPMAVMGIPLASLMGIVMFWGRSQWEPILAAEMAVVVLSSVYLCRAVIPWRSPGIFSVPNRH